MPKHDGGKMKPSSVQNIYDEPAFFEGYKQLRKNRLGFNDQIEQPAIKSLLPEVKEKVVLDIGCGFGDFCYFLCKQGASHVVGIDPSQNMLAEACHLNSNERIVYQCCAIESAYFNDNQFDMVVSSVALHYVEDYLSIVTKVAQWLKSKGYFIFSVEHPICTANLLAKLKTDENNVEYHPVYNYRDEKAFKQTWFIEGVRKYHRTVSTYLNALIQNNFTICTVLEPMPTDAMIAETSSFAVHKIRPPLLLIKAQLSK